MQSNPIPATSGSAQLAGIEAAGFRITDTTFPPQLRLASHYHERACFSVILEGSFDEVLGSATYPLPTCTILVKPPGERHADHFSLTGARVLLLEPDPQHDWLGPCANVFDSVSHFRDGGVAAVAWRVTRELQAPDAVSPLAIEGLVLELLAIATRRHSAPHTGKHPPPWLAIVQDLLHARFGEPLRVADLAVEVGVHPVHLARVFRVHLGMSLGSYVRRLRLDWTATQLAVSDEPLCDLALRAGFADQSHLTRAFKHHLGLTPNQYRQATKR